MASKDRFESRVTTIVNIEDITSDVLHPEQIVLSIPCPSEVKDKRRLLDIGSFCYRDRKPLEMGKKGYTRHVIRSSIIPERTSWIRNFFDFLRSDYDSGRTPNVILRRYSSARLYLEYCDDTENIEESKKYRNPTDKISFIDYIQYLSHRVNLSRNDKHKLSLNSARLYQRDAIKFCTSINSSTESDFKSGIRLISHSGIRPSTTKEPDSDKLSFVLKTHYCLFTGLFDLVINYKPLPFGIRMPTQELYFFSSKNTYARSDLLIANSPDTTASRFINFTEGRTYSIEEIIEIYPGWPKYKARKQRKKFLEILDLANQDSRSGIRRFYAMLAINAFYHLFIANTGLNQQPARDLPWSNDFEFGHANNNLDITIKKRGKRYVVAQIGTHFKRIFNQYLKLREWLLNGKSSNFLFIQEMPDGSILPFAANTPLRYRKSLESFYPEAEWVSAREMRKAKGVYIIRKTNGDLEAASQVLQNNIATTEKHYSEGNDETASEEFSKLWESIRLDRSSNIRSDNVSPTPIHVIENDDTNIETPISSCTNYKNPKRRPEFNENSIQPNCQRHEGCLFCDQIAIHANEKDIRKLLSCQFCLNSLRTVFDHEEHFLSEYGVIIDRIDEIIQQVSESIPNTEGLIHRIKKEVYEEGLVSPYWQNRIDMLIEMKVI